MKPPHLLFVLVATVMGVTSACRTQRNGIPGAAGTPSVDGGPDSAATSTGPNRLLATTVDATAMFPDADWTPPH